jgi:D-3-phosphoglycerate dehydrogenase
MGIGSGLENFQVVRLNSKLSPVGDFEAELWRTHGLEVTQAEASTPEEILQHVADCDALFAVGVLLPAAVIENLSRCRVLSRLGAGTDKIDVAAATRKGILVTNVPEFCVQEQADHTMALLLALERKLPQMARVTAAGSWDESRSLSRSNQRLSTRVLGLIGFGYSAKAVARRALGFGMRVIATRRDMGASRAEADALHVEMVDLDTVLAESDYVSLHLPLTKGTYHLLDEEKLSKMKSDAYFINTSRGAIVDEMALVECLRQGKIAGAGLDTFEHIDPFTVVEAPPDHPFVSMENVVLTPHVAAYSEQAFEDVNRGGIGNLASVLKGCWPPAENVVNREVVPRFPLKDSDDSLPVK